MSYNKSQILEWDIPLTDVQIGIPIGYEVQFSSNSVFNPILYKITTFEEITREPQGVFFYSLDSGENWLDFPIGETGHIFNTSYRMRLIISDAVAGHVFAEKNGTIYKIRPDCKSILDQYTISEFDSTGFEVDSIDNSLYVSGANSTLYKISTVNDLEAGDNSINIHSNPLGVAIDSKRNSLWQINRNEVCLKDLQGNDVFCLELPEIIDVDYSSSSSLSSSSSSSSSSLSSFSSESSSTSSSSYNDTICSVGPWGDPDFAGTYISSGKFNGHNYWKNSSGKFILRSSAPPMWYMTNTLSTATPQYLINNYFDPIGFWSNAHSPNPAGQTAYGKCSTSSSSSSIDSSSSSSIDSSSSSSMDSSSSSSSSSHCCEYGWIETPDNPDVTDWYIPGATETTLPGCIWDVTVTIGTPSPAQATVTGNARGTASTFSAIVTMTVAANIPIAISYSDGSTPSGSAYYNGGVAGPGIYTLTCS